MNVSMRAMTLRNSIATVGRLAASVAVGALMACGGPSESQVPERSSVANQWLLRAKESYRRGDFDDAAEASKRASLSAPKDPEVRLLAGQLSLARLEFDEALTMTDGLTMTQAKFVRGVAYWHKGQLEETADALEAFTADPSVRDAWATQVAKLARRGRGRTPFTIEGGYVSSIEMPRMIGEQYVMPYGVVPIELEGDQVLAAIATNELDLVVDSATRREPEWVSLRFDRIEVRDVPAVVRDLSPLSRRLKVPVRALIGTNLLRRLHATIDRRADQLVFRREDPASPPDASHVPAWYVHGSLSVRANVGPNEADASPFLIDSTRPTTVVLSAESWQRAGVELKSLLPVEGAPDMRSGTLKIFHFAGYDLGRVPAFFSSATEERAGNGVTFGGVVGADLLTNFRMTFSDEGKHLWVEPDPAASIAAKASPANDPPTERLKGTKP